MSRVTLSRLPRGRIRDDENQVFLALLPDADVGAFVHEDRGVGPDVLLAIVDADLPAAAYDVINLVVTQHMHADRCALVQGALAKDDFRIRDVVEVSIGSRLPASLVGRRLHSRYVSVLPQKESVPNMA